jgi:two-component system phosphate regulon sensor histidine kinase PhoR
VSANLNRIISLVNELLFVQELELIEPNLGPVDLPDLLDIVVEKVGEKVDLSECAIEIRSAYLPTVQADADGLTRAFAELLENSVKFSPQSGEVTIALHGREGWIDVEFIDKGVGIAESFLPRLFSRFERTDRIGEFVFEGIGLGLAIAKHIIESHGGSITVKSKEGEGSTFTVHLPLDGGRTDLDDTVELSATDTIYHDQWVDADEQQTRPVSDYPGEEHH